MAPHPFDLVLLEQRFDPRSALVDDAALVGVDLLDLDRRLPHRDAEVAGVADLVDDLGRVQQRLGRDAAAVRAGAAELGILLDAGDLHPELAGADRRDVAAGTAADDHQVVVELALAAPRLPGAARRPARPAPGAAGSRGRSAAGGAGAAAGGAGAAGAEPRLRPELRPPTLPPRRSGRRPCSPAPSRRRRCESPAAPRRPATESPRPPCRSRSRTAAGRAPPSRRPSPATW